MRKRLLLIGVIASAAMMVSAAQGAGVTGRYIVVLRSGVDRPAAIAQARSLGGDVSFEYRHALNGYAARLPVPAVAAIARNPEVLSISADGEGQVTGQVLPAGIDRVDADRSSTRSGDGRGSININVAVLDTGIDTEHPDLNVVGGKDCTSGTGFDDPDAHGTHVAGIIAARDDDIGVVGVVPGARLWSVRVANKNGTFSSSSLLCGIDWVTSTRTDAEPGNDIAVANMSLGAKGSDDGNCGRTKSDALHVAICNSVAVGVTYVAAAGNDGVDFQDLVPASYGEVLTATAMTDLDGRPGGLSSDKPCVAAQTAPFSDDTAAFFSDFATQPADQQHTVAAPGVCIFSTVPGDSQPFPPGTLYGMGSGTSFAAPHVAGTVALCIASGPCAGLTPSRIVQKIVSDAAAYNMKSRGYGFTGDPLHSPDPARYYGYLIRAGLY